MVCGIGRSVFPTQQGELTPQPAPLSSCPVNGCYVEVCSLTFLLEVAAKQD